MARKQTVTAVQPRRIDIRAALGAVISIACFAAVVWWALRQHAPSFPSDPGRILLLLLCVALYAGATALRGWRWHEVLRNAHIGHKQVDCYGLTTVGYMGNTVLPARGGEVLRVVLMSDRSSAGKRQLIGSVLAERLLDATALVLLFVVLTWTGVAGTPTGRVPAAVGLGVVALLALALALYLRARRRGRLESFAARVRPIMRTAKPLLSQLGVVLLVVTCCTWLIEGSIFFLVGKSLQLHINPVEGLFLVVLTSFFSLIPAGPGYVGTFDAALLFGLGALSIHGGTAVGFGLLARFVLFVPITVAGLLLMLVHYGGLRGLHARLLKR